MGQSSEQNIFRQTGDDSFLLDLNGYGCPHVQMFTEKALGKLRSGQELTVFFDSPASGETVAWLCDAQGSELVDRKESGGSFVWTVRKA